MKKLQIILIFIIPFLSSIICPDFFYSEITVKTFLFRSIILATLFLFILEHLLKNKYSGFLSKKFLINRIKNMSFFSSSLLIFVLVMGIVNFLGADISRSFWGSYERMEGYISLIYLSLYFFLLVNLLKTKEIWIKYLMTNVFSSLLVSMYGIFQVLGFLVIGQRNTDGILRIESTIGNSNFLGLYIMINIFLSIYLFLNYWINNKNDLSKKIIWPMFGIFSLIIQIIALFYTASRSAFLGLFGGILFFCFTTLFLKFKKNRQNINWKKMTLIFVSFFFVLIFIFLLYSFIDNGKIKKMYSDSNPINNIVNFSSESKSIQSRFVVWDFSLEGFKEKPMLGWGQENFSYAFDKYKDLRPHGRYIETWHDRAHNIFIDLLIVGGILGLISFIFIICALIFSIIKNKNLKLYEKNILLSLVSAVLINIFFSFLTLTGYILLIIIFGFVEAMSRVSNKKQLKSVLNSKTIIDNEKTIDFLVIGKIGIVSISIIILSLYTVVYPAISAYKLHSGIITLSENPEEAFSEFELATKYNFLGYTEPLIMLLQASSMVINSQYASDDLKERFFKLSIENINKATKRHPLSVKVLIASANFFLSVGEKDEAIRFFKKAGTISPNNIEVENKLKKLVK